MFPNHQLARRIVTLSLRANELSNAILLSKEHVAHVRAEKLKALRNEKLIQQNKLKEQKKHYETIVQRHQGFIEQLLKDKSELCDKIANLSRRFDSQNQAWEHKVVTEVARAKETVLAGEKIRREKWVRENTKKIKVKFECFFHSFEISIIFIFNVQSLHRRFSIFSIQTNDKFLIPFFNIYIILILFQVVVSYYHSKLLFQVEFY